MKKKVLYIILGVVLFTIFVYGLHIRVVTDYANYNGMYYTNCNTVELHKCKIQKDYTIEGETEIYSPKTLQMWWAI